MQKQRNSTITALPKSLGKANDIQIPDTKEALDKIKKLKSEEPKEMICICNDPYCGAGPFKRKR